MALDAQSRDSDDDLLRRYAGGDAAAARALALRHGPRLIVIARRMLDDPSEAEDIAQETLLRLWRSAGNWRPGEAGVAPWLTRVASNLCIDRLRRRRERTGVETPETASAAPSALDGLARAERAAALRGALAHLPPRQRLAIVLRHFDDRSNPEIAETMDLSVEAVESLLARGRRALATRLASRRAELELDNGDF